jgi:PAS domain S-box-containing protein
MKTKQFEVVKKLQHIEEIYRSMIGRISDGLISIDAEGYFTYVNNAASQILNRKPGSLLGKHIWKEFPEFLNHPFYKAYERAINSQEYFYLEVYDRTVARWIENHIYPSPNGVSVFFMDITARKKKESDFVKLAKRNALILDIMQYSFLLTDANLNVVDVNPAFCKTIGYTREEVLKMKVTDFDVKFNEKEIKQNLNKTIESGIIQFDTKNRKKNGTVIDVEVVLTEMEIDGQFYFASFGRDISESKKAEEQIINEKKLSDSVINSLPGIFYLYDKNRKFLRWNKNFEIISKYNSTEIASMHPLDFFDDDEKELLKEKIETAFEKGTCEMEAHFFSKDKEKIPYYFNGKLTYIEGRPCLLGTGIDVSERKKAEESIRSMEMEILNQKVQEQKKITRAILKAQETERNYIGRELHDNVNQILAGTKLYLSMAGRHDKAVKDLVKYPLELIDSSINEIRLLTSKNVTPVRNINLKKLIQALIDNLNKNTTIKTIFNYNITNEIIDDELKLNIYRIVQEQINNIVKHADSLSANISIEAVGNIIRVIVTDDGKGFDINKKREGIGITNMLNRVESFNGKIDIESSPGNGSKIQIEIPYVYKGIKV